jgi:hypothetical protein
MIRGIGMAQIGAGLMQGTNRGLDERRMMDRQDRQDAMVSDEFRRRQALEAGQDQAVFDKWDTFSKADLDGIQSYIPADTVYTPTTGDHVNPDGTLQARPDVPQDLLAGPAIPGAPAPAQAASGSPVKKGLAIPGGVPQKILNRNAYSARSMALGIMGPSSAMMNTADTEAGFDTFKERAQGALSSLQGLKSQISQIIGGRDPNTMDAATRAQLASRLKPLLDEADSQTRLLADSVQAAHTTKDASEARHAFQLLATTGDPGRVADFMAANGAPPDTVASMRLSKYDPQSNRIITQNGTVLDPVSFGISNGLVPLNPKEQADFMMRAAQFQEKLSAAKLNEQLRADTRIQAVLNAGGAKATAMQRYLDTVDQLGALERNGQMDSDKYQQLLHTRDQIALALPVSTGAGREAARGTPAGQEDQLQRDLDRAERGLAAAQRAGIAAGNTTDKGLQAKADADYRAAKAARDAAKAALDASRSRRGIGQVAPGAAPATAPSAPTAFSIN